MIFRLNPSAGQPLYLQLIERVRHAIETGVLQDGDQMPGIRTLAEQLVVSHNTVAKAYTELEHEGLLELRHGAGAFIRAPKAARHTTDKLQQAQQRITDLLQELEAQGFSGEEIRRMFEVRLAQAAAGRQE